MTIKDQKQTSITEIGETDRCPYCRRKMEKIPSRKMKCPYCGEYMYVRTRPLDHKKVLIRENQREEIERQWNKLNKQRELEQLLQSEIYQEQLKRLTSELGSDPTLTELILRVARKLMLEYATKRQWGLYRNCKLNIAQALEYGGNLRAALKAIFEVSYLDINGPNNVMIVDGNVMSYAESEKLGIKDFDPKIAFFAPVVIAWIDQWTNKLNLSEYAAKKLFLEINNKNKPFNKMPIEPKEAWKLLRFYLNHLP